MGNFILFASSYYSGFSWPRLGWGVVDIALIAGACLLVINLSGAYFNRKRAINEQKGRQRSNTINSILQSVIKYVVYFIGGLMALDVLGVNYTPVLASAGVVGVAVGFGAQSLVKDVIAGFFVILEDSYRVGEYVKLGSVTGFVEEIGLRVTKLRDWGKELRIIPNGQVVDVVNYSRGDLNFAMLIPIAYSGDTEAAMRVVEGACAQVAAKYDNFSAPPVVLGIDDLKENRIMVRLSFDANLNDKGFLERQLRLACKEALDEAGTPIPVSNIVTGA